MICQSLNSEIHSTNHEHLHMELHLKTHDLSNSNQADVAHKKVFHN